MKFQPYPEDAEVHDSFATVPLDDGGDEDDHDDSTTPADAPGLLGRLADKVKKRG